jgi:hypothetical protein
MSTLDYIPSVCPAPRDRTKYRTGLEHTAAEEYQQRPEFQVFLGRGYDRDTNSQAQALLAIIGSSFNVINLRSMAQDLRRWGELRLERQASRAEWSLVFYFQFYLDSIRAHWSRCDFRIQQQSTGSSPATEVSVIPGPVTTNHSPANGSIAIDESYAELAFDFYDSGYDNFGLNGDSFYC